MSPDAAERMRVYQEGQRAHGSGAPCPYMDWRRGTWAKGRQAAAEHWARINEPEVIRIVEPVFEHDETLLEELSEDFWFRYVDGTKDPELVKDVMKTYAMQMLRSHSGHP